MQEQHKNTGSLPKYADTYKMLPVRRKQWPTFHFSREGRFYCTIVYMHDALLCIECKFDVNKFIGIKFGKISVFDRCHNLSICNGDYYIIDEIKCFSHCLYILFLFFSVSEILSL